MMNMSPVLLHVGLPKTGTTTLQHQFFPACNEIKLFCLKDIRAFADEIIASPVYFNRKSARDFVSQILSDRRINVFSVERFSGGVPGLCDDSLMRRSFALLNLKACLSHAKIILVLRRQDAFARSYYWEYIWNGGTRTITEVFGITPEGLSRNAFHFFDFTRYVHALENAFPSGVLILTFEEFVSNQQRFLEKLTEFIGVESPNVELTRTRPSRINTVGMAMLRLMNRFFISWLNPKAPFTGIPIRRNKVWHFIHPSRLLAEKLPYTTDRRSPQLMKTSQRILQEVRSENRSLDLEKSLGLKRYGYW